MQNTPNETQRRITALLSDLSGTVCKKCCLLSSISTVALNFACFTWLFVGLIFWSKRLCSCSTAWFLLKLVEIIVMCVQYCLCSDFITSASKQQTQHSRKGRNDVSPQDKQPTGECREGYIAAAMVAAVGCSS